MSALPPGYVIIDAEEAIHDGDEEDGRYGLYDPEGEFLGNLHDRDEVVRLAWVHARGEEMS